MNIQQAKDEIARTYRAYIRRNPDGTHRIPVEQQRPVLLIGPPGIGKTAIMKQVAAECDCPLVAYSMTHHTRQSAIGLPFISQKVYNGVQCSVTEYTMSEIVAAIYDKMQQTGKKSGMLFLDEINCVSETLTPVMLQLLQNKTFGNIPLPEDWIIVAAGNPPEYNKSVRELDMVTMDRVKHIDVAADLEVWQRYAVARDVSPVVRTYLSVWPDHFYRITETERGLCFVTARGWEDMSLMLRAMEEDDAPVDSDWCLQYLQDDEIARSFALYYDLFRHFTKQMQTDVGLYGDFSLAELLMGNPEALASWSSTQCLAAAAMLFHPIQIEARRLAEAGRRLERRAELAALMPRDFSEDSVRAFFDQKREAVAIKHAHDVMMPEDELRERSVLAKLEADVVAWRKLPTEGRDAFSMFEQERMEGERACLRIECKKVAGRIEAAYRALEVCPQGRSARLYLTSDLAASEACAALLAKYSSTSFERYRSQIEV
jgi:hypothetical protein